MSTKRIFRCNLSLLIISIITIISSIVLEFINFSLPIVWIHTIVSIIWSILIFEHLALRWGSIKHWMREIYKLKLKMTKSIIWLFFIVFLSGIISIIKVCISDESTIIGRLHGKFGLLLIVLMLIHIIKRRKWYKGRSTEKYFTPHIDNKKCINCKLCIKHCPANVLGSYEQGVRVLAPDYCFACKKCIEVCSKDAISEESKLCS